jgi:DNA processing protein
VSTADQDKIILTLALAKLEEEVGVRNLRSVWGSLEEISVSPDKLLLLATAIAHKNKLKDYYAQALTIIDKLVESDTQMVCFWQEEYPNLLLKTNDFPKVLFYRSKQKGVDFNKLPQLLSIVGSREMSEYAKGLVHSLISELPAERVTIVSGLAKGVDAATHEAAVEQGIRCVAVLPDSVLKAVPYGNAYLYQMIYEAGGILMAEYFEPQVLAKYHFPKRNRIIAGLSANTVVVQAGGQSGALTTAKLACSYSRLVYTFPARVNDKAFEGNNGLLRAEMAKVIRNCDDLKYELFEDLVKRSFVLRSVERLKLESPDLEEVFNVINTNAGINLDKICDKIDKSVANVLSLLTQLQIRKLITTDMNGNYSII